MNEARRTNIASADHHRRMLQVYHALLGLTVEEADAVLRNVGDMMRASNRVGETPEFLGFVNQFHEKFGVDLHGARDDTPRN